MGSEEKKRRTIGPLLLFVSILGRPNWPLRLCTRPPPNTAPALLLVLTSLLSAAPPQLAYVYKIELNSLFGPSEHCYRDLRRSVSTTVPFCLLSLSIPELQAKGLISPSSVPETSGVKPRSRHATLIQLVVCDFTD